MTGFALIEAAAHDPFAGVLASLELEFEGAADAHMARAMVAAEELDFLWDARVDARRIGAVESLDDDADPAYIWQLIGCLDGRWYVAKAIMGDDGNACDLLQVRRFKDAWDAYEAFDC